MPVFRPKEDDRECIDHFFSLIARPLPNKLVHLNRGDGRRGAKVEIAKGGSYHPAATVLLAAGHGKFLSILWRHKSSGNFP
jgi:hypothetical protein